MNGQAVTGYAIEWSTSIAGTWNTLNVPGQGARCVPNMAPGDTNDCWFEFKQWIDDGTLTADDERYFRLIAHAGNADSPPGLILKRQLGDVGGL